MSTSSGRKRSLRGPTPQHCSFCSSLYARTLRCELLEDRRLLAQITVTSDQDNVDLSDGVTSLREAIFAANIVPGADEIVFDFGHDGPAKILLTQGELRITDALTITGPGAELLSIDNSLTQGPIFNVDNFTNNTAIEVSLSGMTLTGSEQSAIRSVENLTVDSMIFRGNSGQRAGGISVEQGGGQALNAKLTVRNSHFADNHATSTNSFSAGGGILFNSRFGELTVENSTFVGNSSAASGGGLGVSGFGNLVNITDCAFTDNQALRGGGMFVADDNSKLATLTRTDIFDNTAAQAGGGLFVTSKAVTIVDSQIGRNRTTSTATSSTTGGGGIFKQGGDAFVIRGSMISENRSLTDGGGIALVGSGLQLSDSVVNQNAASRGGGISLLQAASVEVSRSTLSGNTAEKEGGGLYSRGANANLRILDSTVSGNSALGSGGGLSVSSGSFLLHNSTVSGNGANFFGGGLVIARGTRQTNIEHSTITNNTADVDENGIGRGGGLFSESSPAINIRHTIIAGNHDNTGMAPELHADFVQTYSLIGVGAEFLGPLADNGGPTKTHALLPGSPAIDAGDPAVTSVPKFDQRFYPFVRVYGSAIDIGAFEAQSLVVDTLVDENDGDYSAGDLSLREAIDLANRIAGPNTIEFSPLLAGGTNLMTMGEYAITDAVEIVGLGAELLAIDASGNDPTTYKAGDGSRVFHIGDGVVANTFQVTLSNMTLTGGDITGNGGAIDSTESIKLLNVNVDRNSADRGGGVYVDSGAFATIELVDCNFTNNGGDQGGAVAVVLGENSTLEITRSTFTRNSSHGTIGGGGAIYVSQIQTARTRIANSSFVYNEAAGNSTPGGGAYISGGCIELVGTEFFQNKARGTSADGGGAFLSGSQVAVQDCYFSQNLSDGNGGSGGGLSARATAGFLISHNRFIENRTDSTTANGGGLNLNFTGGIGTSGSLSDNIFQSNRVKGNTGQGGGLFIDYRGVGNIDIYGNTVVDNQTDSTTGNGGGVAIIASGTGAVQFFDNEITQNATRGRDPGMGLYVRAGSGATVHVRNNTVAENRQFDDGDGIAGLFASAHGGGRIFVEENLITGNSVGVYATSQGGASSALIRLERNVVRDNEIDRGIGGGMYLSAGSGGQIIVGETVIENNESNRSGGGLNLLASSGGAIEIRNSTISGNRAIADTFGYGGAARILNRGGTINLVQMTISGNTADGDGGGLWIKNESGTVSIQHSTITKNTSDADENGVGTGGGLLTQPGPAISISHTIIAGNHDNTGSANDVAGIINSSFTLIGYGAEFLAPLADNGGTTLTHALLPGSPAINAGDPTSVSGANGIPLFDQRGAPFARVAGGRIDIGAYESQPAAGLFSADFDGDGDVDGRDFLLWQRGHGKTAGVTTADGDAMADGDVDGLDLVVWQEMYGAEPPAVSSQVFVDTAMPQMKQLKSSSVVSLSTPAQDQHVHVQEADEPMLRAVLSENLSDRVFDHWLPPRRTYDFGDIVTHRPAKRRA